MTRPVLVPLDGTPASAAALATALRLARTFATDVRLVRVFDVPHDALSARGGLVGASEVGEEMRAAITRELEAEAERARAAGVGATAGLLEGDDVARALLDEARRVNAAAFVMMTHARGALGRMVLGSVSDRVVRAAERPVVVVPPQAAGHAAAVADRPLRRVLVPIDGSAASAMAASHLLELPGRETLEAVLVHVVPGDGPTEEAQADLLTLARGLAESGLAAGAHTVEGDDPAAGIVAAAREHDVDLIAMTTRGEGGLARLAHGSTATAVLRSAHVPVLLRTPDPA